MSKKAVIIDDSLYMRELIKETLSGAGFEIVGTAADGNSGIEMALEHEPDLITLDNVLPDMLGADIARILIKEEGISSKIIMISAIGQDSIIEESKNNGASEYIVKPFTPEDLLEKVNNIF